MKTLSSLTLFVIVAAILAMNPALAETLAPAPVISPNGGAVLAGQMVTITDSLAGTTILYTTNGTTPSSASTIYSDPFPITGSVTVKAVAYESGYGLSTLASAAFTVNQSTTPTPVISPNGGTFSSAQQVTITDDLAGATIFYTTNGTTPTSGSTIYTGAFTVSSSETVKALAYKSGYNVSAQASASFSIASQVTPYPTISPNGGPITGPTQVTITDSLDGSIIFYSIDGSAPTTGSPQYTSPFTISSGGTVKAFAYHTGYTVSATVIATFTTPELVTPTPVISPASGAYGSPLQVTITDALAGATIFYTTNGTTPTTASTIYTGPFYMTASGGVKAFAYMSGYSVSAFASASYSLSLLVTPEPVISPHGGTFSTSQQVTITDSLVGATIYYTTDGSTPTSLSPIYNGPITVSSTEVVKAFAYLSGHTTSNVATASFTISAGVVPTPVITPSGGSFSTAQQVTITDSLAGATIFYTTDGSNPTSLSAVYVGPFSVSSSKTVKAIAYLAGYTVSSVGTASFEIGSGVAPTPVISPNGGTITGPTQVTITDSLVGTTILYTVDGSTPTSQSTIYSGPFSVSSTETVKAIAYLSGYSLSAVAAANFYSTAGVTPNPVITPSGGSYPGGQQVTITDSLAGAIVFYTTNGSTPTSLSPQYSAPINVTATTTIKAMAYLSGYSVSGVTTANIEITAGVTPTPVISPNGGTFGSAQQVTITDSMVGAYIFYTVNGSTPTSQSTLYNGPFTVSANETVKAIAYVSGYSISALASADFAIGAEATPTPIIAPGSGSVATGQQVTITDANVLATIFYTTDGSAPNSQSTHYTGPFTITASETVKAIAGAPGLGVSGVASATYTITGVHTFDAGLAMISAPSDYTGQPLSTVLGYDSPVLATWDPVGGAYDVTPTAPSNFLTVGHGYWARFPNAETIQTAGTSTPTNTPFIMTIGVGWNMIGDPFPVNIPLSGIYVTPTGGAAETYTNAVVSGLLSNTVYGYAGGNYVGSDHLAPYQGYWLYATGGCTLTIPVPQSPPPAPM